MLKKINKPVLGVVGILVVIAMIVSPLFVLVNSPNQGVDTSDISSRIFDPNEQTEQQEQDTEEQEQQEASETTYYTSNVQTAQYYYPENCEERNTLPQNQTQTFASVDELLQTYPNRVIDPKCE